MAFARPHSQTVIVSIVCIIAVVVAIFSMKNDQTASQNAVDDTQMITASQTGSATTISTSTDWKKSFLTGNVTTNGASSVKVATTTAKEDTMTAYLGKATVSGYLALKDAGLENDQATVDSVTNTILSSTLNFKTPIVYSQNELNITPRSDDVTLDNFKSAVAQSLSLYKVTRSEALIARQSIEEKKPELLKQIDPIIRNYQEIIDSLKKISTPSVMATDMLMLINGFNQSKFVAQSLRASKDDPMLAMIGANNYLNGISDMIDALQNIRTYIESRGGTFLFDSTFLTVMLNNE